MTIGDALERLIGQSEDQFSEKDLHEHRSALIDLLYAIGLEEMMGGITTSTAISFANDFIAKSEPDQVQYRTTLSDFILDLSRE